MKRLGEHGKGILFYGIRNYLLLIKTDEKHYVILEQTLIALHPYEVPEIIAVAVERGSPDYLNWINTCLTTD